MLASGGYPQDYKTGFAIGGLADAENSDVEVFHAGTQCKDGVFLTAGGRVLGITATSPSLDLALEKAYKAVGLISFENVHYRRDIGIY